MIRLNAQDGRIVKSRNMGPGDSLTITAGPLAEIPRGDIEVKAAAP